MKKTLKSLVHDGFESIKSLQKLGIVACLKLKRKNRLFKQNNKDKQDSK